VDASVEFDEALFGILIMEHSGDQTAMIDVQVLELVSMFTLIQRIVESAHLNISLMIRDLNRTVILPSICHRVVRVPQLPVGLTWVRPQTQQIQDDVLESQIAGQFESRALGFFFFAAGVVGKNVFLVVEIHVVHDGR
jgi:hypothetical protein